MFAMRIKSNDFLSKNKKAAKIKECNLKKWTIQFFIRKRTKFVHGMIGANITLFF